MLDNEFKSGASWIGFGLNWNANTIVRYMLKRRNWYHPTSVKVSHQTKIEHICRINTQDHLFPVFVARQKSQQNCLYCFTTRQRVIDRTNDFIHAVSESTKDIIVMLLYSWKHNGNTKNVVGWVYVLGIAIPVNLHWMTNAIPITYDK